ncbi:hypothetical protein GIW70_13095 [Pseudomonas syringae]|nr:hypothetical protein [Pseudomonas syringae]MCF5069122.1 hypothetical protein [Pseudomonas syringae]
MDDRHSDYRSRTYPVHEDMAFQRKVWRFEHWGWYTLVLIVVMALSGAFSRGPLSAREAQSSDGKLKVEYEMIHRNGSTNAMKLSINGKANAPAELELSGDFLDAFSIETLQPDPIKAVSAGQGLKLTLQVDAQGQATLYLTLRSDGLGSYSSQVSSPGSASVNFTQFILP